jgi:hypothetical protein|tara:strand:+ start:195 stop:347 length:153 start_codon:yes stop_codon:yes gene_type:complete
MSGKGDKPRPLSIPYKKYADRYDAIFSKPTVAEEKEDEELCEDEPSSKSD